MLLSQAQDPQDAMPKKRDAKKSSQCPPPIRPLSGASWRPPKPQPIQLPTDWPPMFPTNLRDETTLIMLDCAKQCTGLVGFCRCVVAQLTPLFTRDTNAPRPDLISLALNELLRYILITNEGNADERYRLHQEVWQSNEWAALVKAASEKKTTSIAMPVLPAVLQEAAAPAGSALDKATTEILEQPSGGRLADVEAFKKRVLEEQNYKVKNVDIRRVVGRPQDPRSLEHFQHNIAQASTNAIADYDAVLTKMTSAEFMAKLRQVKPAPKSKRKLRR